MIRFRKLFWIEYSRSWGANRAESILTNDAHGVLSGWSLSWQGSKWAGNCFNHGQVASIGRNHAHMLGYRNSSASLFGSIINFSSYGLWPDPKEELFYLLGQNK